MNSNQYLTVGDHGKDLDDETAALLLAELHRSGVIHVAGTVANLDPAESRARIAKGTYNTLGVSIPVAVGTSCGWVDPGLNEYEFDVPYMADPSDVALPGLDLYRDVARSIGDGCLHLILMSGFTDALGMFEDDPALFVRKVGSVTLMSGVESVDGQAFLVPDHTANNDFDYPSAVKLFRELQSHRVPMTIVTRDAAYAAKVPKTFYDDLAATGHPVGVRLKRAQQASIQALWVQANLPEGHPDRSLPWGPAGAPRDAGWFRAAFCDGRGDGLAGADEIWPHVVGFAQYDGLAVFAAVPELRDQLFAPRRVLVDGVEHLLIGAGHGETNVRDRSALVSMFVGVALSAVRPGRHLLGSGCV